MPVDFVPQMGADVPIDGVASRILLACGHQLLARALGHCHDHEVLALQGRIDVFLDVLHADLHLRDKHQVDDGGRQRRIHCDEACIPAHQLHDAHTLVTTRRLDPGVADAPASRLNCRVEAEGLVEVQDIVVDGLRHAHDGDLQAPILRLLVELVCGALGAVAADREEHVDALFLQLVANLLGVEAAAAGLQHTASFVMDFANNLGVEPHRRVLLRITQSIVATLDAQNVPDAILMPQCVGHLPNDGVQARTQASTSDNRCPHLLGLPINVLASIPSHAPVLQCLISVSCFRVVQNNVPHHELVRV
mmetsp:Transcript_18793/g.65521  ORF Transcript_18793/g.65521 Transcript_18793/m.65521 type:complete len:306 (+) Transcript_18793:1101-2018(+)